MEVINEKQTHIEKEQIKSWYRDAFPSVAAFVKRQGGGLDEAREIFQESILIYYEKRISKNFVPNESDQAYLVGIAKKKWLKQRSGKKKIDHLEGIDLTEEKGEQLNTEKVLNHLKLTGEKCLQLLQAFYYQKLNMSQLASRFGFRNERSATVQKYKCLEKVREQVKLKSLTYEDFLN